MKRKMISLFTLFLTVVLSLIWLVACNDGEAKARVVSKQENLVVILIEKTDGAATLLDAMNALKEEEELSFEIADGMILSLNGKGNQTLSASEGDSWMLYTSDSENANTTWGTVTYEGETYGSAAAGVMALKVKENCYYIWSYDHWNY